MALAFKSGKNILWGIILLLIFFFLDFFFHFILKEIVKDGEIFRSIM